MKNPFLQVAKGQIVDHLVLCLMAGSWLSVIAWLLSNRLAVVLLSH